MLLGSLLTLLSLLIFIKPIRQRISILATMFLSFDRPEDRPYTLLWLITRYMGSYLVIALSTIPILMTLAEVFSLHTWDSPLLYVSGGLAFCKSLEDTLERV